jgi:ATP-dependent Clp protease protease subunit
LSHDEIIAIMDAETWLTAEEAKEKGFADEVEEAREIAACLRDGQVIINGQAIDISRFSNFPTDRIPVEQEPAEDKAEQERQARLRRLRLRARL